MLFFCAFLKAPCHLVPYAMMSVKRWSQNPNALSIGKPAIHPATVDLKGKAYELLRQNAARFLLDDIYRNPGPLQFDGPGADAKAVTLCVEDQDYMGRIKKLQEYLEKVFYLYLCMKYIFLALDIGFCSIATAMAVIFSYGTPPYVHVFQVRTIVKPGCSQEVLKAALSVMASVTEVLSVMSSSSSGGQTTL
ncbi:hypothetical protein QQP08_022750 [Theobroma cacao]|nr:hypothetical protein QQP08_022750 [Theobroma cacao]